MRAWLCTSVLHGVLCGTCRVVVWWLGAVSSSSPGLLLQDAPLSDCTDTIDGLDLSEQGYSPARSIRKVHEQTKLADCPQLSLPPVVAFFLIFFLFLGKPYSLWFTNSIHAHDQGIIVLFCSTDCWYVHNYTLGSHPPVRFIMITFTNLPLSLI